jgi:hypothetical protein
MIKFNVGGKTFITTNNSITTEPPNILMKFQEYSESSKLVINTLEDGSIFIDRDPKKFYYILEYLRTRNSNFIFHFFLNFFF